MKLGKMEKRAMTSQKHAKHGIAEEYGVRS